MPRQIITLPALGLAVLLAACGGGATPSSTDDDVLSGISDADTPQELLSLLPTSLCDAQPSRWAFSGADWFMDATPAVLQRLDDLGKTADDAIAAVVITNDANVCSASILRIPGLTADQVRSVNDLVGGDANADQVDVDGRTVWLDHSDEGVAFFYPVDDAVVMASAIDEAHAQEVLRLLPRP